MRHAQRHARLLLAHGNRLDTGAEHFGNVGRRVEREGHNARHQRAMVLLERSGQVPADEQAIDRVHKQGHHRKVHQQDLHEQGRAPEKADIGGRWPAQQVFAHGLPGLVARISQACQGQHQAQGAAHDDAGHRHADGDHGTLPEHLLVFHQDVGSEPAEPLHRGVVVHLSILSNKKTASGPSLQRKSQQPYWGL